MTPDLAAALFALFVGLVFIVGFGSALWFDVSEQIDEATRLPQHRPIPAQCTPADDDTTRIDPSNVIDLRRIREDHWL